MPPSGDRGPTSINPYIATAIAWAVPGAAHMWLGRRQKGLTFFVVLTAMFAIGLWLRGRVFPFQVSEPLVVLMAFADIGMGIPYLVARGLGLANGDVVAITYEYGNTFVIVAGLLNMLVALDAFDIALGRK